MGTNPDTSTRKQTTLGYRIADSRREGGLKIEGVEKPQVVERIKLEASAPKQQAQQREKTPKKPTPLQLAAKARAAMSAGEDDSRSRKLSTVVIPEAQRRAESIRSCRMARLAEIRDEIESEQERQHPKAIAKSSFRFFQTNSDKVKLLLSMKVIRAALAAGETVAVVGRYDEAMLVRHLEAAGIKAVKAITDRSLLLLAQSTSRQDEVEAFFSCLRKKAVAKINRLVLLDFQRFVDTSSEEQAYHSVELLQQVLNTLGSNVLAQFERDGSRDHLFFRKACRSLVPHYHELSFDRRHRKLRVGMEKLIEIDVAPMREVV